jgi:Sulfotransferase family
MLLEALRRSRELHSVQREGHILWDEFHHPRDRGWDSDALGAEDVGEREREYLYWAIRLFVRGHRFVDKTPENCLRIGYLEALFPDATYVFLRRRAAANIASLVEAWRARPRFVKYRLPEPLTGLGELSGNQWSFVLVPGWRDLRDAPLEEICARQYAACNEAMLTARETIAEPRWLDVAYEDVVAEPVTTLRELFGRLGLAFADDVENHASRLAEKVSRTALTAPDEAKRRSQDEAIERVLPLVADLERRLGYGVSGSVAVGTERA